MTIQHDKKSTNYIKIFSTYSYFGVLKTQSTVNFSFIFWSQMTDHNVQYMKLGIVYKKGKARHL